MRTHCAPAACQPEEIAVEGYRPAFDSDAEPAETALPETPLPEAASAKTVPAEILPPDAGQASASGPLTCFDPAQFPLPGAYSLDGMTAIAPAYFPEPGLVERACRPSGQHRAPEEPGDPRRHGDRSTDALKRQIAAVFDAEVC
jgi:hypothetical protein